MFILFLLLWVAAGIAGLYFLTKGIIDLIKKRSGKENLKKGGIAVLASLAFFIIAALATPAEEAEVTQNSEVETELAESKKSEETETELEVEEIVDKPEETEEVNEPEVETKEESSEVNEPAEEVEEPEEEKKEPVEEAPREPEVSREFQNAQQAAEDYLAYSSFSKSGLYDQLLFEEYPEDAAQYAVDKMDEGVNWDIQALEKAKDYLEYSSFSDQGLYEQLLFEGFTEGQAQYAIDNLD